MTTSRLRLRYLFDRYYSKTATPQERDELFAAINAGASDEELSLLIRQAWDDLKPDTRLFSTDKTSAILKNILGADENGKPVKKRGNIILWTKIATAAIVLFFVGIGFHKLMRQQNTVQHITKTKPILHDAQPGGNKAVLTLANGKTIILDNAQNGTLAKLGGTSIKKTANGQLIYDVSALADANTVPSINTITTPRGGQYQVVLPDGTKVWLNSASSLSFPTRFTGTTRQVEITGEAYFEVTKNAAMPFRVKTNKAQIEVLGTHFNVMAYDDESTMKTTLLEGAVNITAGTFSARLRPGQQAQIKASGQSKVVDDIDVDDETAWKNGIFQFREVHIDAILRQAARWYDVDVTYSGKIPDKVFTGRLSRNVKASVLLDILKYTGINLKIEGKKIIVL
ncbi:FecR family protein [Mucilaginibacter terrigena]|uniref:FecR family protein n=1 Tax=Mucilaginibacter terrigena TaxID=2492395 RepID=A0A4Q5LQ72_9SPHI|nr:FecR family protein [Mucilaginibacter terrigena]RYU91591.1 FecR family protein [Mucilaginibacter terrigena]